MSAMGHEQKRYTAFGMSAFLTSIADLSRAFNARVDERFALSKPDDDALAAIMRHARDRRGDRAAHRRTGSVKRQR
jgi:hypothetical protein